MATIQLHPPSSRPSRLKPATAGVKPIREAADAVEANRYREALFALPESKDRPQATHKLADAYSATTMPVAKAASILRGLPAESIEVEARRVASAQAKAVAAENPRLRRAVELRSNLPGITTRERTGLKLALAHATEERITVAAALAKVGLDVATFETTIGQ